jgi:hypothetical protein
MGMVGPVGSGIESGVGSVGMVALKEKGRGIDPDPFVLFLRR